MIVCAIDLDNQKNQKKSAEEKIQRARMNQEKVNIRIIDLRSSLGIHEEIIRVNRY
jgi:hypothetical protein